MQPRNPAQELIAQPIDLETIGRRLQEHDSYESCADFERDMRLLFDNACAYNMEGSEIVEDASHMRALFEATMGSLKANAARDRGLTCKSPLLKPGDGVRVRSKVVARKAMEQCAVLGEWEKARAEKAGKIGTVLEADDDGTLEVQFEDGCKTWWPSDALELPQNTEPSSAADALHAAIKSAWSKVQMAKDEDGRERASLFKELPDRAEYQDYYEVITNPIDLSMIGSRIQQHKCVAFFLCMAAEHILCMIGSRQDTRIFITPCFSNCDDLTFCRTDTPSCAASRPTCGCSSPTRRRTTRKEVRCTRTASLCTRFSKNRLQRVPRRGRSRCFGPWAWALRSCA